jgi:hypothetical protein
MLLLAGRKARPGSRRIPQTQTSGAAWDLLHAPPRGFIPSGLTQPSIGELLPHCSARVPAGIALPFWFCRCLPVPSEDNRMLRPRLPSNSTFIPKPIPSANPASALRLQSTRPVGRLAELLSLDEEGYPMDSKITPAQVSPGVLYLGRNRRPFVLHHYPRCLDRGVRGHARSSGTVK